MLKLYFGDEKGRVQNSTIPVRWCVDKETIDKLKADGVKNPHILIVTMARNQEMTRQLAPLGQLVEFVQFQSPGINKIYAAIVWTESGKFNDLWKEYLQKSSYSRYDNYIFDYDGNFLADSQRIELTEYKVEIPKELFAKEYPDWLKRWVNLWFEGTATDQCYFRRRALVAFTIQPFIVLLYLAFLTGMRAIVFIFLLLCGIRKISISPIFHPWDEEMEDVWLQAKYHGGFLENYLFREKWYLIPFTPIIPIALIGGHIIYQLLTREYLGLMVAVYFAIKFIIAVMLLFLFIGLITVLSGFLTALFAALFKKKIFAATAEFIGNLIEKLINMLPLPEIKEKKILENPELAYKQVDTGLLLICNGDKPTSIDLLPPEKKTIHLRFQNLKAKMCKPIAK